MTNQIEGISSVSIDALQISVELAEWLAKHHPNVKTISDLALLEPFDEIRPNPKDLPGDLPDDLCWSLGYFLWMKLKGHS